MSVFAHQEGLVRIGVQVTLQALHRRIHIAVQVVVGEIVLTLTAAILGAFVMGQTSGIKVLGPGQRCLEAAAVCTFITHGPADNGGTVLISLDTALGAVHGCFHEIGVICKGFVPGLYVILPDVVFLAVQSGSAVAFIVSFVDDHEAILVTQLVEHGSVGIVAGTNCVEVKLLNHPQIPLHVLDADDGTGNRIGVVTVDTTELDGAAVQQDHVILNMDCTEADTVGDDFVRGFQQQGVQVGLLRIPEGRILNCEDCLMGVCTAIERLDGACANTLLCCIQQLDLGRNKLTIVCEPDPDGGFFLIQQRGGEVIADAVFGALQDVHIAEDTGGAELILVLQIAAIAPFQDHNGQGVLAFSDGFCDIKLRGGVRNFAVAQECTVQPHIEAGVNTFKVQVGFGCICIAFIHEVVQVGTARILIRNKRRISGERITNVGILMLVITVILPDTGNGNRSPGRGIIVLFKEEILKIVDAFTVLEFPVVVQQLEPIGMLPVFHQVIHSAGCRDEVRSVGCGAYMMGMQVFVIGRNNHNFLLRYFVFP